jgi:pilus assembly protein TadC
MKNSSCKTFSIFGQSTFSLAGQPEVTTLCGHNLLNFDYVFLGRRLLINGFPLPRAVADYAERSHLEIAEFSSPIDTMQMWSMRESGGGSYISLEVLAQVS